MTTGRLIVIEAGDGSGKATQSALLLERLRAEGRRAIKVDYPNYNSESAALIKMYLRGDFGSDPAAVNPYAASAFYAVDRIASYKKEWESFYADGGIVIADRYTTSNMIHQAAKIVDPRQREEYLAWLWDFEFVKCGLPVPDCVIFLDMPPAVSGQLLKNRPSKAGTAASDIHERNAAYLAECYRVSLLVAAKYGWVRVDCCPEGAVRSIEDIHAEIWRIAQRCLGPEY
ncbi:MAG: thymidylate kinase [Negativicutes bacterium]|nr:thymidylate kinase [Negativicutes bacterium]